MSPEDNLAALGVRQLPPTPLGDERVDNANVADVNDEPCRDRSRLVEAVPAQTESDFETDRGALVRLSAGDVAPFVELVKQDPGFPFEPDAIAALNRLARDRPADFERLRSRLKADTHVRLAALETAMKAAAAVAMQQTVLANRSSTTRSIHGMSRLRAPSS
jgi:hypothetical protein